MMEQTQATFECSQCRRQFAWKPALAGRLVRCTCGAAVQVPAQGPVEPPEPVILPAAFSNAGYNPNLGYAPHQVSGTYVAGNASRPGLLITIAIFSILIGCISVLASGVMATIWRQWYLGSVPRAPVAVAVAPAPLKTVTPYTGAAMRAGSMPQTARDPVIEDVASRISLSTSQRDLLDRLLAEKGKEILPNVSVDKLQPMESSSPLRINSPKGHIFIDDTSARYVPDRRGSETTVTHDFVTLPHGVGKHVNVIAIDESIAALKIRLPDVSDAQISFVVDKLLNGPAYNWPDNGQGRMTSDPLASAETWPGGRLTTTIGKDNYTIKADGTGTQVFGMPNGFTNATGRPLMPPPAPGFTPMLPGDYHLMNWLFLYCSAVVLLALYLICSGIATLMRPAWWARLHLPYAVIKLIFIATEISLSLAYFSSITGQSTSTRRFSIDLGMHGLYVTAIIQCIYPLVLILIYAFNPRLRRMPS